MLESVEGLSVVKAEHKAPLLRAILIYVMDRLPDHPNIFIVGPPWAVADLWVPDEGGDGETKLLSNAFCEYPLGDAVGMSPSAHSSDETRKRCASRTVRREPTVSGQHTQPTRATRGRGQGMLRGSLGASVSSLSTNLQGGGLGLATAGGRRTRLPKRKMRTPRSA